MILEGFSRSWNWNAAQSKASKSVNDLSTTYSDLLSSSLIPLFVLLFLKKLEKNIELVLATGGTNWMVWILASVTYSSSTNFSISAPFSYIVAKHSLHYFKSLINQATHINKNFQSKSSTSMTSMINNVGCVCSYFLHKKVLVPAGDT